MSPVKMHDLRTAGAGKPAASPRRLSTKQQPADWPDEEEQMEPTVRMMALRDFSGDPGEGFHHKGSVFMTTPARARKYEGANGSIAFAERIGQKSERMVEIPSDGPEANLAEVAEEAPADVESSDQADAPTSTKRAKKRGRG